MKYFSAGFGIFSHYLTFPFNYLFQKYESWKKRFLSVELDRTQCSRVLGQREDSNVGAACEVAGRERAHL